MIPAPGCLRRHWVDLVTWFVKKKKKKKKKIVSSQPALSCCGNCFVVPVVKASASRVADMEFDSRLSHRGYSRLSRTSDLIVAFHWLPCQAPGLLGPALGLVNPVSAD